MPSATTASMFAAPSLLTLRPADLPHAKASSAIVSQTVTAFLMVRVGVIVPVGLGASVAVVLAAKGLLSLGPALDIVEEVSAAVKLPLLLDRRDYATRAVAAIVVASGPRGNLSAFTAPSLLLVRPAPHPALQAHLAVEVAAVAGGVRRRRAATSEGLAAVLLLLVDPSILPVRVTHHAIKGEVCLRRPPQAGRGVAGCRGALPLSGLGVPGAGHAGAGGAAAPDANGRGGGEDAKTEAQQD
mmetsp:Transcript_17631/g.50268  ORF Transcript_17631/g.50268 Transcript_17631/m.50268 type:complete len:242 (+) Transcript_17631:407-1132(+)